MSDCVKLLSCRQVPPLIGTRASLFSFFPHRETPGEIPQVHYFNILTAKGRGTHVSRDDLVPARTVTVRSDSEFSSYPAPSIVCI